VDFAAFNASLEHQCREQFGKTSAMQEKTIGELFDEEKDSLITQLLEAREEKMLWLITTFCR